MTRLRQTIYVVQAFCGPSREADNVRAFTRKPDAVDFKCRCEAYARQRPPTPDVTNWGREWTERQHALHDDWEHRHDTWKRKHPAKGLHYYNEFEVVALQLYS